MKKSDPDRRDVWWSDDAVSLAIIGLVLVGVLVALAALAYAIATGAVAADIQVTGTVPVTPLIYGGAAGLAAMVYLAFQDVYGADDVERATDAVEDITEDNDQQ